MNTAPAAGLPKPPVSSIWGQKSLRQRWNLVYTRGAKKIHLLRLRKGGA